MSAVHDWPLPGRVRWDRDADQAASHYRQTPTMRRRIVDQSARDAYSKHLHLLDHLPIAAGYNDLHLRRLDVGEPVVAQGWKFGYHGYEHYCLEPDGRVTPVEAIHVDESAKVLTVENWRRPDGSLVYKRIPRSPEFRRSGQRTSLLDLVLAMVASAGTMRIMPHDSLGGSTFQSFGALLRPRPCRRRPQPG